MRRYNFIRPLWILGIAYLTNIIVTTICGMLGSSVETAGNIGFISMIIAALITFNVLNKRKKKFK